MDQYDDKVRTRLAEIQAAAGVPHSQISLEVLYFLPAGFLNAYMTMFTRAVKADGGESGRNSSQQEAGALGKARGAGAKTNGKRYKKTFVVLDERALQTKTTVDKRLRSMAREIEILLAGGDVKATQGQCDHCGMFVQGSWKFCPQDGLALSN